MTSAPPPEAAGALTLEQALGHCVQLLRREALVEAEGALEQVLAHWPEQPDALHFLGVLRHTQGRDDEAVALIRRALAQEPANPGAWNNLGNVLVESQQLEAAAVAYARSVAEAGEAPAAADPLNNLCVLHRRAGRLHEAEAAARKALALHANSGAAWFNLSLVLLDQGQVAEGLQANNRAITLWPRQLVARDQVLRALLALGERGKAAELYREWLAEAPDNPVIRHQLAACLGDNAPDRASDDCMEQLFDSFAASFDSKLQSLDYRAPQLVAEALGRLLGAPRRKLRIADLGCGTGLCGPLLRPYARRLVGCDLSAGMLRRAKPRRVYDALHKAELVHYLDTQPGRYDVLVSADTLCYFGVLDAALAAAGRALAPGGWLVFTVEALPEHDEAPHRLQPAGRYAHHQRYVRGLLQAEGFESITLEPVALRQELGKPVSGWLVSARRAGGRRET